MTASIFRLHESLSVVLQYRERIGDKYSFIGTWGMLCMGVEAMVFRMNPPSLTVAHSMPTAIVSAV